MAGWIKLWRTLIENGHLKMPGTAFKLWIYCLLEATPYPNPKRDLAIGELWLSYQGIRENLGEENKKVSMSTVSAALKYLEHNGYLKLEAKRFKGIKAKVIHWSDYQAFVYTPSNQTTQGVAEATSTTTTKVVDNYSYSSTSTTPQVAENRAEPSNIKAFATPKNYIENDIENSNKNINVVVTIVDEFAKEFQRPLSPNEIKQLALWQNSFSNDLIKEALVLASLQDKRTFAYIGGILKNWSRTGITTVEEAQSKKTKPRSKGGNRNAKSKPGYRPNEIDWENEPDTL